VGATRLSEPGWLDELPATLQLQLQHATPGSRYAQEELQRGLDATAAQMRLREQAAATQYG